MSLGDHIRTAREAASLSQAHLAVAVGVTQRTIGNWERGTANPRSKLDALERVLGVRLRDTNTDGSPRLDDATDAQIIANLAGRLAERNDRVRALTDQVHDLQSGPPLTQRWAARTRRDANPSDPP